MQTYSKVQLIGRIHVLFSPSGEDAPPPELPIIIGCALALPDAEYVVLDPEAGDEIPAGIYGLPHRQIVAWDTAPGPMSSGYGDVHLLDSVAGPGLAVSVGGSAAQSAGVFYVVPAQLLGWIDPED